MDLNAAIGLAGFAVVILGALWRFSHAQGKQTQLITDLLTRFDKMETKMDQEIEAVHGRVSKLADKVDRTNERQVWMLGKMGINDEGVSG